MGGYRPNNEKERIRHRVQIIAGHTRRLLTMLESNAYCIDVLHQSQAISAALKQVDHHLLEHHLKTCAAKAIQEGNAKKAISEIMAVIKKQRI